MPGREVLETATWLAHLGIIEVRKSLVVRCADPLDGDFPPPVRDCDGHITLRPNVDEGGGDYRCPSCERLVSPVVDEKRRYERMTVVLQRSGIEKFLIDALGASAKGRSFLEGVLKLPTDGLNAFVCLVEFCTDRQYLRRGTAIAQPFVYVTVEPDTPARLLKDSRDPPRRTRRYPDWGGVSVEPTDGGGDIPFLNGDDQRRYPDFRGRSFTGRLSGVQAPRRRRFAVRSHSTGFSIDDRLIVDASRTSACRVLQALFQRFADDLSAGGDVRPISVEELADIVQENEDDVRDAESVRRTIDRVRDQITAVIRRETGRPIGDNDIIETVSRTGALKGSRGYRLNPRTVMLAAATP